MKTSVRLAIITLTQKIIDLAKLDPNQVVEFDNWLHFAIENPVKNINRVIFKTSEYFGPFRLVKPGQLVYFDYLNPGKGPITRVGYVLEDQSDSSLLIWDLTANGIRRFDHAYICKPHLLIGQDNNE